MLTGPHFCQLVGITYRQLDYWTRLHVLAPSQEAQGSGTVRLYSIEEARVARVLAVLRDFGASLDVLREVAGQLRVMELRGVIFIDGNGMVGQHPLGLCWAIDLDPIVRDVDDALAYASATA